MLNEMGQNCSWIKGKRTYKKTRSTLHKFYIDGHLPLGPIMMIIFFHRIPPGQHHHPSVTQISLIKKKEKGEIYSACLHRRRW